MADLLKGKHAIVTGGASGIGLAIVRSFLMAGAHVCIFDVNNNTLTSVLAEERARGYEKINGVCLDVCDNNFIKGFFATSSSDWKIDILVNNAGIDRPYSWERDDAGVWQSIIDTNLTGARNVTAEVVKRMCEEKRSGCIIFITSIHTALAFPGGAAYDASKHALVGLMRNLALELGPHGIRANAVAPGFIYPTGITGGLSQTEVESFASKIPSRRPGTPEDVANVVTFLASDQASYINGAEIRIDGGLSIQNHLF